MRCKKWQHATWRHGLYISSIILSLVLLLHTWSDKVTENCQNWDQKPNKRQTHYTDEVLPKTVEIFTVWYQSIDGLKGTSEVFFVESWAWVKYTGRVTSCGVKKWTWLSDRGKLGSRTEEGRGMEGRKVGKYFSWSLYSVIIIIGHGFNLNLTMARMLCCDVGGS